MGEDQNNSGLDLSSPIESQWVTWASNLLFPSPNRAVTIRKWKERILHLSSQGSKKKIEYTVNPTVANKCVISA